MKEISSCPKEIKIQESLYQKIFNKDNICDLEGFYKDELDQVYWDLHLFVYTDWNYLYLFDLLHWFIRKYPLLDYSRLYDDFEEKLNSFEHSHVKITLTEEKPIYVYINDAVKYHMLFKHVDQDYFVEFIMNIFWCIATVKYWLEENHGYIYD